MNMRNIVVLSFGIFLFGARLAHADMPPPAGYKEKCKVELKEQEGTTCEDCKNGPETAATSSAVKSSTPAPSSPTCARPQGRASGRRVWCDGPPREEEGCSCALRTGRRSAVLAGLVVLAVGLPEAPQTAWSPAPRNPCARIIELNIFCDDIEDHVAGRKAPGRPGESATAQRPDRRLRRGGGRQRSLPPCRGVSWPGCSAPRRRIRGTKAGGSCRETQRREGCSRPDEDVAEFGRVAGQGKAGGGGGRRPNPVS